MSNLENLLVDAGVVDDALKDEIYEAIKDFVGVDKASSRLVLHQAYRQMSDRGKQLIIILLGLKAMELLGVRSTAWVLPKELPTLAGLPEGTIKSLLRTLSGDGAIGRRQTGKDVTYGLDFYHLEGALKRVRTVRGKGMTVAEK